jgi:hypothetical protein
VERRSKGEVGRKGECEREGRPRGERWKVRGGSTLRSLSSDMTEKV